MSITGKERNELREKPSIFANKILKINLHKGQKEIVDCNARFLAVAAPRRWGKSELAAVTAIHLAATNENAKIICISRSKGQADELFKKIYRLVSNSILSQFLTRSTQSVMEFTNGSAIESKASRDPDKIRGFTASLVIVDESAFVDDSVYETLFPIVLNTKNKEQGRLILISTPGIKAGEFWRAFQPDSIYTTFHYTHEHAVFADGSRLLPQSELDREAQRLGANSPIFLREYMCQWGQASDSFFDPIGVDKALIQNIPQIHYGQDDRKYVIGVDLAVKNDYTVFVVLDCSDKKNLKIVRTVRFNGKSPDQIMDDLYKEVVAFRPNNVLIDEGNIGAAIVAQLKVKYPSIRWNGFNFNTSSKVPLMTDLNVAMCTGIIQIPDDDIIREELISFYYEENQNTGHLKLGGSGAHDDYPIAIALAVRAAGVFQQKGSFVIGASSGRLTGVEHTIGYKPKIIY